MNGCTAYAQGVPRSPEINKSQAVSLTLPSSSTSPLSDLENKASDALTNEKVKMTSSSVSKKNISTSEKESPTLASDSPSISSSSTSRASPSFQPAKNNAVLASTSGWQYVNKDSYVLITGYGGKDKNVTVPNTFSGKPVHIDSNFGSIIRNASIQKFSFDMSNSRKVVYDGSSMNNLFYGNTYLTNVDLSGLDTSQVTSMDKTFFNCFNMTNINLSGIDTSHVTDMGAMFAGASNLISVDLRGLNTSHVTYMGYMFQNIPKLTSVNLSGCDTSQVTSMYYMFGGASGLTSVDFSGCDTSHVTDMGYMFYETSSLIHLDLTSFNTSRVSNMRNMFRTSSTTSLFIETNDSRLLNYNYSGDNREIEANITLNANGGTFSDGSSKKTYLTSCAITPSDWVLKQQMSTLMSFLAQVPTKANSAFEKYIPSKAVSSFTTVQDYFGTTYTAQWRALCHPHFESVPTSIGIQIETGYYASEITAIEKPLIISPSDYSWKLTVRLLQWNSDNLRLLYGYKYLKNGYGLNVINLNTSTQVHQGNACDDPINISKGWGKKQLGEDMGIEVDIQSQSTVVAGTYSGVLEWNLLEAP
ncbi:BspA family leucine-rich repeat surface protein [Lactococcus garvieae]|nr:BspA family leucine-rich repeat surface protein [Lactococcus garvieae]